MRKLSELDLANKTVLLRADLNVPLKSDGTVGDDNRIKEFIPTLQYLLDKNAKVVIISHFGDPEGKPTAALSLAPVARHLAQLIKRDVPLVSDCLGEGAKNAVKALTPGNALMLENIRFYPGEKNNDKQFAATLAKLGDVYVNDAFACCHRKHASMVALAEQFKDRAAGLLVEKEIDFYDRALTNPKTPLCVILGGAKLSTKLAILEALSEKADKLIIGGAMANTFLAAQGLQMGRSLYEADFIPKAVEVLMKMARRGSKVYLPVDFIAAPDLKAGDLARAVTAQEFPADLRALDIGPATSILFREAIQNAQTVVWNGPMGAFEVEAFAKGTTDMIESIASCHGLKVAGGGETDAAIHQMELEHKFDFISTGGGAFLKLLEGGGLPALAVL